MKHALLTTCLLLTALSGCVGDPDHGPADPSPSLYERGDDVQHAEYHNQSASPRPRCGVVHESSSPGMGPVPVYHAESNVTLPNGTAGGVLTLTMSHASVHAHYALRVYAPSGGLAHESVSDNGLKYRQNVTIGSWPSDEGEWRAAMDTGASIHTVIYWTWTLDHPDCEGT